jgi:hypothetical protein
MVEYILCYMAQQNSEAIFTNSSRTLLAKCSQTYSYLLGRVGGEGGGGVHPSCGPAPLTLPYTLLYIYTVHELCSRTVGEYLLWGPLPATRLASRKYLLSKISKSGQGHHSLYSTLWLRRSRALLLRYCTSFTVCPSTLPLLHAKSRRPLSWDRCSFHMFQIMKK